MTKKQAREELYITGKEKTSTSERDKNRKHKGKKQQIRSRKEGRKMAGISKKNANAR